MCRDPLLWRARGKGATFWVRSVMNGCGASGRFWMCLILYDAVRVKYVFPVRLCRWLSLYFLRYIGIRKIALKEKTAGGIFLPSPSWVFFPGPGRLARWRLLPACGPRAGFSWGFCRQGEFWGSREQRSRGAPQTQGDGWLGGGQPNGWGERAGWLAW